MEESDREHPSRQDPLPIPHRGPGSIPRREPLPSGPPGWVVKSTLLIGVMIFSFWGTLLALDRWVLNRRDDAGFGSAGLRELRPIFSIDFGRRNWVVANSKTRAVVVEKAISIESTADINEYQWLTTPIPVQPNTEVSVSYNIDVKDGKMGLGVLDFESSSWIATKEISSSSEAIQLKVPSKQIQVILFGVSPPPSRASLLELTILRIL